MPLWESTERLDSMEHFRDYGDSFINYPFRYYCRKCVRNFNTKVRVGRCTKCLGEEIVELPSGTHNVSMSRFQSGREPGFFKRLFAKFKRKNSEQKDVRKELLQSQEKLIAAINHHTGRINEFLKNIVAGSFKNNKSLRDSYNANNYPASQNNHDKKRFRLFCLMPAKKDAEEMPSR